jgi:hypothetical protein
MRSCFLLQTLTTWHRRKVCHRPENIFKNLHGDLIVLPKSLYEFMPYLYVVIGVAAALVLYNSYAIISGVLFLIVAFMIFYMRLKNRTEKVDRYERLYVEEKKKR